MTDLDLDALEAVAKAATPGPWRLGNYAIVLADGDAPTIVADGEPADAAHIATFDPPTVLGLIAEARSAAEVRERLAEVEAERDTLAGGVTEWQDNYAQALERIDSWVEYGDRMEERAGIAEQKAAAQAEVIERVRALAWVEREEWESLHVAGCDNYDCSTCTQINCAEDVRQALDAAPTPPTTDAEDDRGPAN